MQDSTRTLAWADQVGSVNHEQRAGLAWHTEQAPDQAAAELRRLHRLRRAVVDVFGVIADQSRVPEPAWAILRRAAGEAWLVLSRSCGTSGCARPGSWTRWRPSAAPIAYAAWELLTSGPLDRVKRCHACPWLYLDQSKNGSRRWCSMDDCGKAVKMSRYGPSARARPLHVLGLLALPLSPPPRAPTS